MTTTPIANAISTTASDLVASYAQRLGPRLIGLVFATGFQPLDDLLEGGFQPHDLVVLGGKPGVGKTAAALQWARTVARSDQQAIYVCFEHSRHALLARLFCLEASELARSDEFLELQRLRRLAKEIARGTCSIGEFTSGALGDEVVTRVRAYGPNLHIVEASGSRTTAEEINRVVQDKTSGPAAVFVDYLQKIPATAGYDDEEAKTMHVAESLKDLAMSNDIAVVAIAAADRHGLDSRRMHLHHLRGSTAIAHEADVVLIMNDKNLVVSKAHSAFDPVRAESFERKVVFSIEKNRGGPAWLDLEFDKDLANFRFGPKGGFVSERLIDDVLVLE